MPDENQLTPAELELELHLAGLEPAMHGLKREIIFFRAGQRMALRRLHRWQAAFSVILLAILNLWWWQLRPPPVQESLRVASQDRRDWPPQPAASAARTLPSEIPMRGSGTGEYLRLRTEVITKGLQVLPSPSLTPTPSDGVKTVSDWRLFAALTPSLAPLPAVR